MPDVVSHAPRQSDAEDRNDGLAGDQYLEGHRAWLELRSLEKEDKTQTSSQRRLELLNSISRTFARTMRASLNERKRFTRERERLLERERSARSEAEASRRSLREVLESIGDAFSTLDESWRYTYANDQAVEYAGRSRRNLLDRRLWDIYPELADSESYAKLRRAAEGPSVAQIELRSERLGRWLQHRVFQAPAGVSIYTRDITERREAEEALRRSEERYRSLVMATSAIVFTATGQGYFTADAPAWEEFTGQRPDEYAGLGWLRAVHPEDRDRAADEWSRAVEAGEPVEISCRLRRRDGSHRYVLLRGVPIPEATGDRVREWIGAVSDVHEQQLAREERERFLAREWKARAAAEERRRISRELHDRVAHSMAVAYQSLQIHEALRERDPESARDRMRIAQQTTREALDATRNLSMELRRTEAADGLSSALSNLLRTVLPPDIKSEVSVEGDESAIPPEVREPLFVILREAIRNTVSHSKANRIAVDVAVLPGAVVGTVRDTGDGFDSGTIAGNGIRSMRERTSLLGGDFQLYSAEGEGTEVRVEVVFSSKAGT